MNVEHWVEQVERELRAEGTAERAEAAKRYLKSELEHYGVRVPSLRAVVTRAFRREPAADRAELVALAAASWRPPVFELACATRADSCAKTYDGSSFRAGGESDQRRATNPTASELVRQ